MSCTVPPPHAVHHHAIGTLGLSKSAFQSTHLHLKPHLNLDLELTLTLSKIFSATYLQWFLFSWFLVASRLPSSIISYFPYYPCPVTLEQHLSTRYVIMFGAGMLLWVYQGTKLSKGLHTNSVSVKEKVGSRKPSNPKQLLTWLHRNPKWQKVCTDRRQPWVGSPPRSSLAKHAMLQRRLVYGFVSSCSFLGSLFNELKRFHCKLIFISFLLRSLLSFLQLFSIYLYAQVPTGTLGPNQQSGGMASQHPSAAMRPMRNHQAMHLCRIQIMSDCLFRAAPYQNLNPVGPKWWENDGRMAGKPS